MTKIKEVPILEADRIVETISVLATRIEERFPESGLRAICDDVLRVARDTRGRVDWAQRPNWALRILVGLLLVLVGLGVLAALLRFIDAVDTMKFLNAVTIFESGINDAVFVGIGIFFLASLERRIKRRRILRAIHELRSLAHVVDMHQLTKDPARSLDPAGDTASSPKRTLSPFELARYLDYCSELLALIGKVAVLHLQAIEDSIVLASANEVEMLTTGLARKVWQKLMILELTARGTEPVVGSATSPSNPGPPPR